MERMLQRRLPLGGRVASLTGLLQADAYTGFQKLYGPARTKPDTITEVACWAHTRRSLFDEWVQHKSPTAKAALDRIAAVLRTVVRDTDNVRTISLIGRC
jgi:hypothetical protein